MERNVEGIVVFGDFGMALFSCCLSRSFDWLCVKGASDDRKASPSLEKENFLLKNIKKTRLQLLLTCILQE
jgi:hypothetical protein